MHFISLMDTLTLEKIPVLTKSCNNGDNIYSLRKKKKNSGKNPNQFRLLNSQRYRMYSSLMIAKDIR